MAQSGHHVAEFQCPRKADITKACCHVRFWPKADIGYSRLLLRNLTLNPIPLIAIPCCNPIIVTFVGVVLSPEGRQCGDATSLQELLFRLLCRSPRAQHSNRVRRVGVVMPFSRSDTEYVGRIRAFREELQKLGWTEGTNVQFDERWTTDNMDTVRAEAASLMASNPDAVMAWGGRVIPVLMQLSRSIPIVIPGASDPVGVGWVRNLAHPGGNVTGFASFELPVLGKLLEILKQIAPTLVRVAMIYNPDNPNTVFYCHSFEAAAGPLAIESITVPIHGLVDVDRTLSSLAERDNTGILFPGDLTTLALRGAIVDLVTQRRLPAVYADPLFVKVGGLAAYSVDRVELFRLSAGYVDRILRGEKAGDLPFQQPTKYALIINLKTAKALGLTVPQTLLASADEVIE